MKTLIICFLFCCPIILNAQLYNTALIPDSLLENAHEVIWEDYMHFEVLSEREGNTSVRQVITLLDKESSANRLSVYYDKDTRIKQLSATIYDAFGKVVHKFKKNDFNDIGLVDGTSIYDDSRAKALTINSNKYGYPYTILFEYETIEKGVGFAVFPRRFFQSYYQSVIKSDLIIEVPRHIPIQYKLLNLDIEPEEQLVDGKNRYHWAVRHLKAIPREPYGPSEFEILPFLMTSSGKFQIEDYSGSMSDWESYSSFMSKLYEGRQELPDDIKQQIQSLTADIQNPKEKIEVLYKYLQNNTRYVSIQLGIGGWQPFSAEYVAKNKYGDCKALSNYMHSMLSEVGIESYPALIYGGDLPYNVSEDFTHPLFNHVILYVPSEDMWLECTSSYNPPGYIGEWTSNRNTLLVKPEGGTLKATPSLPIEGNTWISNTSIKIQDSGAADIQGETHAAGAQHEKLRWRVFEFSEQEKRDWWLELTELPELKLDQLEIKASETQPTASVSYTGEVPHYASKAGKRLFLPLNQINKWDFVFPKKEKRTQPISIEKGFIHMDSIHLELPPSYQIENLNDQPIHINSAFGEYRLEIAKEDKKITCLRSFRLNKGNHAASEYEALRDFLIAVSKADKSMAVLVERKT
ncbi:MAG: DUF3857 and transglutaminase domain-containing protein [Chitinophagales bacterium]|nr:DUF3857 and transglutaminase domain-containing protein [Chitinophagales bacterium]